MKIKQFLHTHEASKAPKQQRWVNRKWQFMYQVNHFFRYVFSVASRFRFCWSLFIRTEFFFLLSFVTGQEWTLIKLKV